MMNRGWKLRDTIDVELYIEAAPDGNKWRGVRIITRL